MVAVTGAYGFDANMNTIAGNGDATSTGDGGPATDASIAGPAYVSLGADGNIYFSDRGGAEVRALNGSKIYGVIGTGVAGNTGDGGLALDATINHPTGVAFAYYGNLYVADSANARIRKEAAGTGTITLFAGGGASGLGDGGPATEGQLSTTIGGIAFDGSGNLYIADTGNHRIRMVSATTGYITTVAGTGVAGLTGDDGPANVAAVNSPSDVAMGASGDMYVADTGNNRIRMIDVTTLIITTVAGGGVGGLGDGGLPLAARLNGPRGIALTSTSLFISDTGNHRIRRVSFSDNKIITVAGVGAAGFSGDGLTPTAARIDTPTGLLMSSGGYIVFADTGNNRIRAFVPVTGNRPPAALDATYDILADTPLDLTLVATDPDGDTPTYSIMGGPLHGALGALNTATGAVTYTPAAGFTGTDSFTFRATDGTDISHYGLIQINVGVSGNTDLFTVTKATFALNFKKPGTDKLSITAIVDDLNFTGTDLSGVLIASADITVGGGATAYTNSVVLTKNAYKSKNLALKITTKTGLLKLDLKGLNLRDTLGDFGATNANVLKTDEVAVAIPVSIVIHVSNKTFYLLDWVQYLYTAKATKSGKGVKW